MGEKKIGWFKGCAIGCGLLLLVLILGCVAFGYFTVSPFHKAVDKREKIEEQFGPRDAFVPQADGRIPADRIEAFIGVRESLMELCREFEESFGQFERMEQLGDEEELEGGTLTKELFKTMGSAFGMAPLMGRFFDTRNEALLEQGMGLGEYAYLYTVIYGKELNAFEDLEGAHIDSNPLEGRIRDDILTILGNQRAAIEALPEEERDVAFLEALTEELDRLEENYGRFPWQDGPPPPLEESLALYRERLRELYCMETAGLELHRSESNGLNVQSIE